MTVNKCSHCGHTTTVVEEDEKKHDRTKLFGRITFAALALLALGGVLGLVLGSASIFGILAAVGVLTFASNLLLLEQGDI